MNRSFLVLLSGYALLPVAVGQGLPMEHSADIRLENHQPDLGGYHTQDRVQILEDWKGSHLPDPGEISIEQMRVQSEGGHHHEGPRNDSSGSNPGMSPAPPGNSSIDKLLEIIEAQKSEISLLKKKVELLETQLKK
jgi:hypothetical protein